MKINTHFKIAALVGALVIAGVACTPNTEESEQGSENARNEQQSVSTGFNRLTNAQQIPVFDWSQERQTLIDIESIRANGAITTTAFYLEGIGLVAWCPSIGAPVPSTYQLSASQQYIDIKGDGTEQHFPVDQGEPTGVYVGESTGTWTVCVDDAGTKFAQYWEGYTASTSGIMDYQADLRLQPSDVTFTFTDNPEE